MSFLGMEYRCTAVSYGRKGIVRCEYKYRELVSTPGSLVKQPIPERTLFCPECGGKLSPMLIEDVWEDD